MQIKYILRLSACSIGAIVLGVTVPGHAQSITDGKLVAPDLSDNFEDPNWLYTLPRNGSSANGKWYGSFRGTPTLVQTINSPSGSVPGQSKSLQVAKAEQDVDSLNAQSDLVYRPYNTQSPLGYPQRADLPLYVTRVYLPSMADYNAIGNSSYQSFGHRVEMQDGGNIYYPSIWVDYDSSPSRPTFRVRLSGLDVETGPTIDAAGGWWSLGIGFDAAGVTRYYASPGTDPLLASDEFFNANGFIGGTGVRMDQINYHFYSLGYSPGSDSSLTYIIDDSLIYVDDESAFVPEPGSAALLVGLITVAGRRRRRVKFH